MKKNDVQELLKIAITTDDINIKKSLSNYIFDYIKLNDNIAQDDSTEIIEIFDKPSYSSFCTIVNPRELPARKDFDTVKK